MSVFEVMMLNELREPFAEWARSRGLRMVHVPNTSADTFIVVPVAEPVAGEGE